MIILVGASASGKTEIAKYLAANKSIVKVITHTTRPKREGEKEDVDYHFVSKEQFLSLKEENAFVETTLYNGNYYGCSKSEIADDKCLIVDPQGLSSFLKLKNKSIVSFFLDAPEEIRRRRMEGRGDDIKLIEKRIENDRITFAPSALPKIDFTIEVGEKTISELASEILSKYFSKIKK